MRSTVFLTSLLAFRMAVAQQPSEGDRQAIRGITALVVLENRKY